MAYSIELKQKALNYSKLNSKCTILGFPLKVSLSNHNGKPFHSSTSSERTVLVVFEVKSLYLEECGNINQVATAFGVDRSTIRAWVKKKQSGNLSHCSGGYRYSKINKEQLLNRTPRVRASNFWGAVHFFQ